MAQLSRLLMTLGAALLIGGALLRLFGTRLGHLPGDVRIGDSVFIPIGSCIVVSVLVTLLANVLGRIFWR